jgi:hypothetical protein
MNDTKSNLRTGNRPAEEPSVLVGDMEEALGKAGCAICRMLARGERHYLWNFLFEGVMDAVSRNRVLEAWGFCADHTRMLAEIEEEAWSGKHLGSGVLYEALVERALKVMAEPTRKRGLTPATLAALKAALTPRQPCRACELRAASTEIYLTRFVEELARADFRERVRQSEGLCPAHLSDVFRRAPNASDRIFLIATARGRREGLLEEIRTRRNQPHAGDGWTDSVLWDSLIQALDVIVGTSPSVVEDSASPNGTIGEVCGGCAQEQEGEAGYWTRLWSADRAHAPLSSLRHLCARHVWQWVAQFSRRESSGEAFDLFCHLVLAELGAQAARMGTWLATARLSAHAGSPFEPSMPCAVCALPAERTDLDSRQHLCLPHLRAALAASSESTAYALIERERAYLERLLRDLREMIRKSDVNFAAEPKGDEQHAWVRAGAFAAGESAVEGFPRAPTRRFDNWLAYSLRC